MSWLLPTALGLRLIDLDRGERLIGLPSAHALTVVDAAGAVLLLAGSLLPLRVGRRQLARGRGIRPPRRVIWIAAVSAGVALLAVAVLAPDFQGRKYVVGAIVLVLQGFVALTILGRRDP